MKTKIKWIKDPIKVIVNPETNLECGNYCTNRSVCASDCNVCDTNCSPYYVPCIIDIF